MLPDNVQPGAGPSPAGKRPYDYRPPAEPYLVVLHADDDFLIVSKQSGLLSVPGRGPDLADCLEARVRTRFPEATIVHRLDLETLGVMVMARNRTAHRCLSRQFEQRLVQKVYIARVAGRIEADAGKIDAPLICDWPNRPRQIVDTLNGRAALTAWQVIVREDHVTRVRLMPKTGRSHQLRVHMLTIGHPILGDTLYAPAAACAAVDRLQLHAQSLAFHHPSGRIVRRSLPVLRMARRSSIINERYTGPRCRYPSSQKRGTCREMGPGDERRGDAELNFSTGLTGHQRQASRMTGQVRTQARIAGLCLPCPAW